MLLVQVIVLIDDAAQHVCLFLPLEASAVAETLLVQPDSGGAEVWRKWHQWCHAILHNRLFLLVTVTTLDRCHASSEFSVDPSANW